MKQEEIKPEGAEQNPEQENNVDLNELSEKLKRLEQSNQRLLDESKTWKSKYQSIRSEIEENQNEELKQKNDFKGLYEKTLQEKESIMESLRSEKKAALETTLKYEIAKNAKDAVDTDLLLAAIKLKKKDLLGYDNDSGSWKGVDVAISDMRNEIPSLFSQDKTGMVNGRPKSALPKEKTIDERIMEDPNGMLKEALAALFQS